MAEQYDGGVISTPTHRIQCKKDSIEKGKDKDGVSNTFVAFS